MYNVGICMTSVLLCSPVTAKGGGLGGLVVEDGLDLFHELWSQLLDELERAHVVVDLLDLWETN